MNFIAFALFAYATATPAPLIPLGDSSVPNTTLLELAATQITETTANSLFALLDTVEATNQAALSDNADAISANVAQLDGLNTNKGILDAELARYTANKAGLSDHLNNPLIKLTNDLLADVEKGIAANHEVQKDLDAAKGDLDDEAASHTKIRQIVEDESASADTSELLELTAERIAASTAKALLALVGTAEAANAAALSEVAKAKKTNEDELSVMNNDKEIVEGMLEKHKANAQGLSSHINDVFIKQFKKGLEELDKTIAATVLVQTALEDEAERLGEETVSHEKIRQVIEDEAAAWVTIFDCQGIVESQWQTLAQSSRRVRICTRGSNTDCVTTVAGSYPLKNLKNGNFNIDDRSLDSCNRECINTVWEGPEARLNQLVWTCPPRSPFLYHACGNHGGLHITANGIGDSTVDSYCKWNWGHANDNLVVQLQVENGEEEAPEVEEPVGTVAPVEEESAWCQCGWWCGVASQCGDKVCQGKQKCGIIDPAGRSCDTTKEEGCTVCSCGPGGCACPPK